MQIFSYTQYLSLRDDPILTAVVGVIVIVGNVSVVPIVMTTVVVNGDAKYLIKHLRTNYQQP